MKFDFRNEDIASEFDRLDKDGNGVLSPDEVVVLIKDIMHLDDVRAAKMVSFITILQYTCTHVRVCMSAH